MQSRVSPVLRVLVCGVLVLTGASCGAVRPSCMDETGVILTATGHVEAGATASYVVTSLKSSNLMMRLTWPDTQATLALRATITDCGGHVGCTMSTLQPSPGPGGPSPTPLPWPPGLREMLVDGWVGKTYRVEITGDGDRAADFTLGVTYRIDCES